MAEFIAYFFGSAAYSAVGFIVGWFVGREARSIEEIKRSVAHLEEENAPMHPTDEADAPVEEPTSPSRHKRGLWRLFDMDKIAKVVLVLAAFTFVQSAYVSYTQRSINECLANYQQDFSETADKRNSFAEQERVALQDLFEKLVDPKATDAEVAAEVADAADVYRRMDIKRENTQFPELSACDS